MRHRPRPDGRPHAEPAAELAARVASAPGRRFAGFLTYPAPEGAVAFLAAAVADVRRRGLAVTVTEYRAGMYTFFDRNSIAAGAATLVDLALTVRATVVSRPEPRLEPLDAGSKALAAEPGPDGGHGLVLEARGSRIARLNEEHAHVELAEGDQLELGQEVSVVPNHVCVVANLFDRLWTERAARVTRSGPVDAQGRSR